MKPANEPTNIEYYNKYQSWKTLFIKKLVVFFALLLFLTLICYVIFSFMDNMNKLNRIFPEVNGEDVLDESSPDMLKDYAMIEWYNYAHSDKSEEAMLKINTDNLQGFGDNLRESSSFFNALEKKFNITVFGHEVQGNVGREYLRSAIFIELLDYLMPILIFATDFLLESFAGVCIIWIAYENKTHEVSKIQSAVFMMTFFNAALAILLINARFDYRPSYHFLFNGIYTDFSDDWYDQSSEFFVTPMFMEISTPFLEFLIDFIKQKSLALIDRRFTDPKLYKTKGNTALDYAELNSGTENVLSDKYPRILTISMIAGFYGFGLPMIPITVFLCLASTYVFEKVLAMVYYRKPPLYDDTLNKVSIYYLKWGAFLYVAIAYWMLTNKQMFDNVLDPIAYKDQIEDYHHYIFELPKKPQQLILLIFSVALFIGLASYDIIMYIMLPMLSSNHEINKEVEGLSPFSKAIKDKDRLMLFLEDKERRNAYNYKVLFDNFYYKLSRNIKSKDAMAMTKGISGWDPNIGYITDAVSYDLLTLPDYSIKFSYVPVSKRRKEHEKVNLDSEFTRLVLDYPYHKNIDMIISSAKPGQKENTI